MEAFSVHGTLKAPSRRIISLAPSVTEMLFYLGMGGEVVGVTRHCNYPPEVKDKEIIGSFQMPDIERILALAPDTIIGLNSLHRHVPEIIKNESVGVILFGYHTVPGILDGMEAVASLAVVKNQALERVTRLRKRLGALENAAGSRAPVRIVFLISESPLMMPARLSYQYDALRLAGANQLPGGYAQYERVTLEEVVHFNPEIVLACGRHQGEPPPKMCPGCRSERPICQRIVEDIARKPGWRETAAALNGNIVAVPCHWLCRPGPRLIDGIEAIAGIIRGYRTSA